MRRIFIVGFMTAAVGVSLAVGGPVWAADEPTVAELKATIQSLEARVAELENRLKEYEGGSANEPDRWDPFAEMRRMQDEMNRLFDDSLDRSPFVMPGVHVNAAEPHIEDAGDAYRIRLDLPGMDDQSVSVEARQGVLMIEGKKESRTEEAGPGRVYATRASGLFRRSIPIPKDAVGEGMQVQYADDVLTITLKKK